MLLESLNIPLICQLVLYFLKKNGFIFEDINRDLIKIESQSQGVLTAKEAIKLKASSTLHSNHMPTTQRAFEYMKRVLYAPPSMCLYRKQHIFFRPF